MTSSRAKKVGHELPLFLFSHFNSIRLSLSSSSSTVFRCVFDKSLFQSIDYLSIGSFIPSSTRLLHVSLFFFPLVHLTLHFPASFSCICMCLGIHGKARFQREIKHNEKKVEKREGVSETEGKDREERSRRRGRRVSREEEKKSCRISFFFCLWLLFPLSLSQRSSALSSFTSNFLWLEFLLLTLLSLLRIPGIISICMICFFATISLTSYFSSVSFFSFLRWSEEPSGALCLFSCVIHAREQKEEKKMKKNTLSFLSCILPVS